MKSCWITIILAFLAMFLINNIDLAYLKPETEELSGLYEQKLQSNFDLIQNENYTDNQSDVLHLIEKSMQNINLDFDNSSKNFDKLDFTNDLIFSFDDKYGLFSFSLKDTEEIKNDSSIKHIEKRDLLSHNSTNEFGEKGFQTIIFLKKEHKEYLKKFDDCINTKLVLGEFQLLEFGSYWYPNMQYAWFDESQYKIGNINFIPEIMVYANNYIRLAVLGSNNLNFVRKMHNYIQKNEYKFLSFKCKIQQLYIYNDYYLIIFQDGETFWFGKYDKEKNDLEFQTSVNKEYDTQYNRCTFRNLYESDRRKTLCCKKYAFGTLLHKFLKGVITQEKLNRQLEECFDHKKPIILAKALQFEFEPKV
ncbi:hypothetical protein GVAV_002677 [Gurleya vavrai]